METLTENAEGNHEPSQQSWKVQRLVEISDNLNYHISVQHPK